MQDDLWLAFLLVGPMTLVWGVAGLLRLARRETAQSDPAPAPQDVAVLIAAHNEALGIAESIRSAARLVPPAQIFVVSDGSSDETADLARSAGAQVLDLERNRGKAGAIAAAIEAFEIAARFEILLLLDADTRLSDDYLATGLPMFGDREVVAVAGRASTLRGDGIRAPVAAIVLAYRERAYVTLQFLQRYGQAATWANAVQIVPGFASMYRTRVLAHIDIAAPGLAIEDYNMTFEVHAKRLGRIAFHPRCAIAYTQDPDTLSDYARQLRRWNLGFWQTVRRHGRRVGGLRAPLVLLLADLLSASAATVIALPAAFVLLALRLGTFVVGPAHSGADALANAALVLGVLLMPDLALTLVASAILRRPAMLALGLAFPALRLIDAVLCLSGLLASFSSQASSGRWRSPARRPAAGGAEGSDLAEHAGQVGA